MMSSTERKDKIWITWESHRRTKSIAKKLNDVYLLELNCNLRPGIRHLYLTFLTIKFVLLHKPKLVIVQSPSNVLAFLTITLRRLLGFKVIIDAHNGGVRPFNKKNYKYIWIFNYIHRTADLIIVTNKRLAKIIENSGGTPFVLEDTIPDIKIQKKIKMAGATNFAFICTYEDDEPYMEVIKAAKKIDPGVCIHFTGNYKKIDGAIIADAPKNIRFTGYLSDQDYVDLLGACDAIIDLTNEKDCLVCGAYEALALGKPMILTNDQSIKEYFSEGVVYTNNNRIDIAQSISKISTGFAEREHDIRQLRGKIEIDWDVKLQNLERHIDLMINVEEL